MQSCFCIYSSIPCVLCMPRLVIAPTCFISQDRLDDCPASLGAVVQSNKRCNREQQSVCCAKISDNGMESGGHRPSVFHQPTVGS